MIVNYDKKTFTVQATDLDFFVVVVVDAVVDVVVDSVVDVVVVVDDFFVVVVDDFFVVVDVVVVFVTVLKFQCYATLFLRHCRSDKVS